MAPPKTKSNDLQARRYCCWMLYQAGAFEVVRVLIMSDWFTVLAKSS